MGYRITLPLVERETSLLTVHENSGHKVRNIICYLEHRLRQPLQEYLTIVNDVTLKKRQPNLLCRDVSFDYLLRTTRSATTDCVTQHNSVSWYVHLQLSMTYGMAVSRYTSCRTKRGADTYCYRIQKYAQVRCAVQHIRLSIILATCMPYVGGCFNNAPLPFSMCVDCLKENCLQHSAQLT